MKKRSIDHIVYAVFDLEAGMREMEKKLGVSPTFGGYHKTKGTKNALINLGNMCYLELIAIDEANTDIAPPRWMGVDVLTKPQTTRWALKSDDLASDAKILQTYDADMGETFGGSRHTAAGSLLKWDMILPLSTPEVELVPFMVDWSQTSVHPAESLPDMGCTLVEIFATHPQPKSFLPTFQALNCDFRIEKGLRKSLHMRIQSPKGLVEL